MIPGKGLSPPPVGSGPIFKGCKRPGLRLEFIIPPSRYFAFFSPPSPGGKVSFWAPMIPPVCRLFSGAKPARGDLPRADRMEPAAFREIYGRYGPLAWSMIGRAGVPERDREDVFMESWEAIFAALESFSGRSSLATWIGRIVRNKAVDRIRKNVPLSLDDAELLHRAESPRPGVTPGSGRDAVRREAGELLRKFFKGLSAGRRLIVEQWLEGLSYREIAKVVAARTGREADTNYVGKELYLAKRRLAELMSAAGISSLEDIWE